MALAEGKPSDSVSGKPAVHQRFISGMMNNYENLLYEDEEARYHKWCRGTPPTPACNENTDDELLNRKDEAGAGGRTDRWFIHPGIVTSHRNSSASKKDGFKHAQKVHTLSDDVMAGKLSSYLTGWTGMAMCCTSTEIFELLCRFRDRTDTNSTYVQKRWRRLTNLLFFLTFQR